MPYVLVFLLALAAGGGVATVTYRNGRVAAASPETWTETYREGAPADVDESGAPRRRPLPSAPTARTRMIGVAGLAGAAIAGAGLIAFIAYLIWRVLEGIFSSPPA